MLAVFLPVCCIQENLENEYGIEDEAMSLYLFTSSMIVPSESDLRITADSDGRERWMRLPDEA